MNVSQTIKERRSIRKFTGESVDKKMLEAIVDHGRFAAFPANVQPLKFGIVADEALCGEVFPHTKWAGYLENGAPKEGERPAAYIAVLGDKDIKQSFEVEAGAAVTNMMLISHEMGLATCWIGALDRKELAKVLNLPEKYDLLYLLAVGYPAQKSIPVDMEDGNVKYYMGEDNILRVPKRSMNEVLIFNK